MATTFSMTGSLRVTPRLADELNLTDIIDTATVNLSFALADGTGASQANTYWKDVVTVAGSGSQTITLSALPLNVFGGTGTLNIAATKVLIARNRSTTATVSLAMNAHVTATLGPEGLVYATKTDATGWAATSITLTNAGATAADIELYLVGEKA